MKIKCRIAFLFLLFNLWLAGVGANVWGGDSLVDNGHKVEMAIRQKDTLTNALQGVVMRTVTAKSFVAAFETLHYQLSYTNALARRPRQYTIDHLDWDSEAKSHNERIQMLLIIGENNHKDALDGLFEVMGYTQMMITPSMYEPLPDGPGDVCFIRSFPITRKDGAPEIRNRIWFCRDNIGVEVMCPGGINLYPIAEAVDTAIKASVAAQPPSH